MTRNPTVRTTVFAVLGAATLFLLALYGLRHTNLALALGLPWKPPRQITLGPEAPAAATLRLTAPDSPVAVGQTFTVTVSISGLTDRLSAFQFDLAYDPNIIRFVGLQPGAGLKATRRSVLCPQPVSLTTGVRLACATTGDTQGLSGSGELAVITFLALTQGQSDLTPHAVQAYSDARPPQALGVTGEGTRLVVGGWQLWLPIVNR